MTIEASAAQEGMSRAEKLRAEIATLNQMTVETRAQDLSIERGMHAGTIPMSEGTQTLEANNAAVRAQREEIAARARELGITLDEALRIGIEGEPAH